ALFCAYNSCCLRLGMRRGNDRRFESAGIIGFWRLSNFQRNDGCEWGFVVYEHIGLNIKLKLAGNVGDNVGQPDAFAGFDAGVENRSVRCQCPGNLGG
ncbi:MAG: hypothetical protein ACLQVN_01135, partial [Bryobacteraceae bacterium]